MAGEIAVSCRAQVQENGSSAHLFGEGCKTGRVLAGMPTALRTGLGLLTLLECVEDFAGRLRRQILL